MIKIDEYIEQLKSPRLRLAVSIQTRLITYIREFLLKAGFQEILPVIISPVTDPLTDYRVRGEVECYGFKYQITKSMIFHKQLALHTAPRIFCFSPNVRIETADRKNTGRHLIEFVQLDLEVRQASREEIIELGERLFSSVIGRIKKEASDDLKMIKRELPSFQRPFKRISYKEAVDTYGDDFELKLSEELVEPAWLLDFPLEYREFYDRQDEKKPGTLVDMDLIYPGGFGEALSGGEREYQLEKIKNRIRQKGIDLNSYNLYLQLAEKGLYPSGGFGFGLERLTRFVCGFNDVADTRLFAKKPGVYGL
ncbi:MAG: asparagine synthetase [Candidatus Saccharicenans sp.]|jgi:asparaginyl-tRNA synthetase|nr:asparagine synthetase [Candidatus Saccharicenans sp.]